MKLSKNKKDLLQACIDGDVATVEKLLNERENVDLICNDEGDTLLMTAVKNNKELVIEALLSHGANVNAKNDEGETALIMACTAYPYKDAIVKMLLNNGADVCISNDFGQTALSIACERRKIITVKDLLAHNANVNMRNRNGETALSIACRREDNYEVIKELIDNGADVNIIANDGTTPLINACIWSGDDKTIEKLLNQNVDVNHGGIDINVDTALVRLCGKNNLKMVRKILECGADVNKEGKHGCTPLTEACRVNNIDMVKVLLEYGAEIEGKNSQGKTALDYACARGNIEMARELIDSGASLSNISEESMQFITENLSDCSTIKILPAISNRDNENIGKYLDEYFNEINKDTSLKEMSVLEYRRHISKFYQVNNYIKDLKNSKEFKELREETKILKEKIENANKVGSTSEELDEIKQKVHRNKMILKELRTFEMNIKDMLNVKILRPIYCMKQSIDFELK